MEEKLLETLCETTELCILPVLNKNIDEELITAGKILLYLFLFSFSQLRFSDHFQEFRLMLNDKLNLLLDIFHKYETILMTEEEFDSRLKKVINTGFCILFYICHFLVQGEFGGSSLRANFKKFLISN